MGSNFKFKVITYIDRVNILSDIFINYYLKFFKPEEFYFLILESEFKNISEYLLNKDFTGECFEKIINGYFGTVDDILSVQNNVLNKFIENGFTVVYADIDEIIYHHDLRNYIINNLKDYITPSGVVLLPNKNDGPITQNNKILDQRNHCVFNNQYHSKTCILNKKYIWDGGRHNKNSNKISDDIFLIDIGKCCKEIILYNNRFTNKIYKNVSFRYSTENKSDIDKMVSKFFPSLKPLPEYITKTKLF